jgi:hypothetical protein
MKERKRGVRIETPPGSIVLTLRENTRQKYSRSEIIQNEADLKSRSYLCDQ